MDAGRAQAFVVGGGHHVAGLDELRQPRRGWRRPGPTTTGRTGRRPRWSGGPTTRSGGPPLGAGAVGTMITPDTAMSFPVMLVEWYSTW